MGDICYAICDPSVLQSELNMVIFQYPWPLAVRGIRNQESSFSNFYICSHSYWTETTIIDCKNILASLYLKIFYTYLKIFCSKYNQNIRWQTRECLQDSESECVFRNVAMILNMSLPSCLSGALERSHLFHLWTYSHRTAMHSGMKKGLPQGIYGKKSIQW